MGRKSLFALLLFAAAAPAIAASDLAVGSLLVAARDLRDPNFAQTVVLIVNYNEDGAIGLILNRPTQRPMARLFGDWKDAAGRTDHAYEGGPVETASILAVVRLPETEPVGKRVAPGVFVTGEEETLQKQIAARAGPDRLRVYLGYAGWGPGQLEREIRAGGWHVQRPRPAVLFDAKPEALWDRLIGEVESVLARASRPVSRAAFNPGGKMGMKGGATDSTGLHFTWEVVPGSELP